MSAPGSLEMEPHAPHAPSAEPESATALVVLHGAARTFGSGSAARVALRETTCEIPAGARIALMGPSGSGKSTLLHLMAGLDKPTVGSVEWPGIGSLAELRPGPVALVFQGPSLLGDLSILENVALPLAFGGTRDRDAKNAAMRALEHLEVADLADKLPEEISGGQAQRVAICRALAGKPRLILADEPTGQLDRQIGDQVVATLIAAADHAGAGLVVSTHDPSIAARFPTRWQLADGQLLTTTAADPEEAQR